MEIKEIEVKRIFNLGNYENITVGIIASINELDNFEENKEDIFEKINDDLIKMRDSIIS